MYGVVHGGVFEDLRRESVDFVLRSAFEGIAVGGSLGHSRDAMYALLETRVMPVREAVNARFRSTISS